MTSKFTFALALAAFASAKGVTSIIKPEYTPPAWCLQSMPDHFGIAVKSIGGKVPRDLHHLQHVLPVIVNEIGDGQPQAHPNATTRPSSMTKKYSSTTTVTISSTVTIRSSTLPNGSRPPVSEIQDGQIQAPGLSTSVPKSKHSSATSDRRSTMSMVPVSTIHDGQVQAPTSLAVRAAVKTPHASHPMSGFEKACRTKGSLEMKLSNGILTDSKNRTGYVASNRQLQFDAPPQAGAVYTAGWSVCDGTLALGPSTYFWQCLSGDFYNLYDQLWAAQCEPIHLQVVELVECETA